MTAHELARLLLDSPNLVVKVYDSNARGFDFPDMVPIDSIIVENNEVHLVLGEYNG